MKPEQPHHKRKIRKMNRARASGSVGEQLRMLVLPTVAALIVGWRTFAALGDLPLSAVLACTAFITITPLVASMSDRDLKRKGENK
jgi:hypothetical protein